MMVTESMQSGSLKLSPDSRMQMTNMLPLLFKSCKPLRRILKLWKPSWSVHLLRRTAKHIQERQKYLLAGLLGQSLVGQYSLLHDKSVYALGYRDPCTIYAAYMCVISPISNFHY